MGGDMSHEEVAELLGAFALDAVDGEDGETVHRHLAECRRCQAGLSEFHEVAGLLANSGGDAPPEVWENIAARVALSQLAAVGEPGGEGGGETRRHEDHDMVDSVVSMAGFPTTAKGRHRFRDGARNTVRWIIPVSTAAALIVIAVLGLQVAHLNDRVGKLEAAQSLQGMSQAVQAAVLDPQATRVQLTSVKHEGSTLGQIVLLPSGSAFMINGDMPGLPSNETYQLWGRISGAMISISLLGNHPKDVALTIDPDARFGGFAVTIEPAGGVVTPTASPVAVSGSFST